MHQDRDLRWTLPLMLLAILAIASSLPAQPPPRGILNEPAPSWEVKQWINLPKGAPGLDVDDLRGKVVYLYGFQSWCPGCHARGFPTLTRLIDRFQNERDIVFVAVQTVFEGFDTNDVQAA